MKTGLLAALLCAAVGASASWQWTMTSKERDTFTVKKSDQGGVRLGLDGAFYNILTDAEAYSLGRALLEAAGQLEKQGGPYCARTPNGEQSCCVSGDIGSLRIP